MRWYVACQPRRRRQRRAGTASAWRRRLASRYEGIGYVRSANAARVENVCLPSESCTARVQSGRSGGALAGSMRSAAAGSCEGCGDGCAVGVYLESWARGGSYDVAWKRARRRRCRAWGCGACIACDACIRILYRQAGAPRVVMCHGSSAYCSRSRSAPRPGLCGCGVWPGDFFHYLKLFSCARSAGRGSGGCKREREGCPGRGLFSMLAERVALAQGARYDAAFELNALVSEPDRLESVQRQGEAGQCWRPIRSVRRRGVGGANQRHCRARARLQPMSSGGYQPRSRLYVACVLEPRSERIVPRNIELVARICVE